MIVECKRFFADDSGQDLIEYSLLAGLISLVAVTVVVKCWHRRERSLGRRRRHSHFDPHTVRPVYSWRARQYARSVGSVSATMPAGPLAPHHASYRRFLRQFKTERTLEGRRPAV